MASVDRAKDNRTFTFSVSTKGTQCFAINCSNYQNPTSKLNGVTFHRFPNKQKELHRYLIWERNCRRRDKKPSIRSLLCSDHFNNDCMDRTGQTVRLKSDAVPTNFNVPEHLQTVSFCERRSDNSKRARLEDLEAVIYDEPTHVSNSDILYHKKDHPYALDIEMVKDKIVYLETRVQDLQKKARNATIREGRAKATCKLHIQKLKNQNLINAELETKLAAYQDIPLDLFHKPHGEYTEEQRNFSLTLHLYSPKAYEFLRTVLPLPAGRSLRRWLENIEAEPGISTCMINTLINKKDENPDEYTHCSLMLDAMAIRKQVTYDSHAGKLVGFVDLGTGIDETDEAKEALVFMLVGIKSKWKAPVAYYLSKGLQAEVQAELLVGCIEKLSECGFVIHSVTMDGHASNISMCHLLGCNFEYHQQDPKPFFQLPGITNRIWVVMDACHMVKLIRNALEAYGTLMSAKGAIKWDHIRQLNEVQEEIGLRLGNRLSANHLAFKQQIMKVSLAVQTLSNSVARALETAEELGVQGFHLCEPTIEFIEVIDRLFDILNSRSPYGKGYKKPLTPHNIQYIMEFLFETKSYLLSLRTADRILVSSSRRKTGFMGMIINIDSILGLCSDLFYTDEHPIKYLLTYKLSQDHLELFFNAVRRIGGWNNNPTVVQFKAAFRRLISRAGTTTSGSSGNVVGMDDTAIIQASTSTYVPSTVSRNSEDDMPLDNEIADNYYNFNAKHTLLIDNVLVYISGYVVRKALPQLKCFICRSVIVNPATTYNNTHFLITIKDNGGLLKPSDGLVKIITIAEKLLRYMSPKNTPSHSCTMLKLQAAVLEEVGGVDLLKLKSHIDDTHLGIDNHYYDLIRLVVGIFFKLRQHHIVRLHNIKLKAKSIRQKLTKSILFMGQ